MKRLYLLIMIFVGFSLSSCALLNSPVEEQAPKKVVPINQKTSQASSTTTPAQLASESTAPKLFLFDRKLKNPMAIQVYPKGSRLSHPYTVLAKESVSKYNSNGIKRQEANIRDALRKLAASVGGDAVINVINNRDYVSGTIVSFQRNHVG